MKDDLVELFKIPQDKFLNISKSVLSATPDEWLAVTSRQKKWEAHKDTESIVLKMGPSRIDSKFTDVWIAKWETIINNNLLSLLRNEIGDFEIVRMIISRLKPHSIVSEHIDTEEILRKSHRLHLPIKTNENVVFNINRSSYHLKEGVVYEINNQAPHSVFNNSKYDRVHLIFDYIL